MKVGVAIGTFGDLAEWTELVQPALISAMGQASSVQWVHGSSLHEARNEAASRLSDMDYIIFLDADDELSDGYVDAMLNAVIPGRDAILRPATIGVYEDGSTDAEAVLIPRTDMKKANCVVIGAMVPYPLFEKVGGFDDWPILEDWDLWQRMMIAGAVIREVPAAVYRVHVHPGSRNTDPSHGRVYSEIRAKHAQAWAR